MPQYYILILHIFQLQQLAKISDKNDPATSYAKFYCWSCTGLGLFRWWHRSAIVISTTAITTTTTIGSYAITSTQFTWITHLTFVGSQTSPLFFQCWGTTTYYTTTILGSKTIHVRGATYGTASGLQSIYIVGTFRVLDKIFQILLLFFMDLHLLLTELESHWTHSNTSAAHLLQRFSLHLWHSGRSSASSESHLVRKCFARFPKQPWAWIVAANSKKKKERIKIFPNSSHMVSPLQLTSIIDCGTNIHTIGTGFHTLICRAQAIDTLALVTGTLRRNRVNL